MLLATYLELPERKLEKYILEDEEGAFNYTNNHNKAYYYAKEKGKRSLDRDIERKKERERKRERERERKREREQLPSRPQ